MTKINEKEAESGPFEKNCSHSFGRFKTYHCCQISFYKRAIEIRVKKCLNSKWSQWTTVSFNFHQMAVPKRTTMLAHCNLKQNTWLCSKQSSFFPFMHCPLVANRKTWWSIDWHLGHAGWCLPKIEKLGYWSLVFFLLG